MTMRMSMRTIMAAGALAAGTLLVAPAAQAAPQTTPTGGTAIATDRGTPKPGPMSCQAGTSIFKGWSTCTGGDGSTSHRVVVTCTFKFIFVKHVNGPWAASGQTSKAHCPPLFIAKKATVELGTSSTRTPHDSAAGFRSGRR